MAKVKYYAKENSSIGTHSFYAVPIPNGTELDPTRGDDVAPIVPDCSLFCAIEFQSIEDPQTAKVMNGEISINETR